jgi:hypothetical protein
VPKALVEDIIKANHDPVYVAHPGTKRTVDPISLSYWWPSMWKSVEDYIRKCDSCQRRKEERVCGAVRENGGAFIPFRSQSMDITGPYLVTPRKNKYLLTFIDHFSKWVETYPISDTIAETCARVYSSQILTRQCTGFTLITDQGRSFMSAFFKETCKIIGIRK